MFLDSLVPLYLGQNFCPALLAIIYLKISKESKKFKQKKKGKAQANSLERKFLKEMVERELDKLERSAMKKFIVDYILLTQDLINQYSSLGDLLHQSGQREES